MTAGFGNIANQLVRGEIVRTGNFVMLLKRQRPDLVQRVIPNSILSSLAFFSGF